MLLFLMLNPSEDTLQRLHVYYPLVAYSKKFFFPVQNWILRWSSVPH